MKLWMTRNYGPNNGVKFWASEPTLSVPHAIDKSCGWYAGNDHVGEIGLKHFEALANQPAPLEGSKELVNAKIVITPGDKGK